MTIELYHSMRNIPLADGFRRTENDYIEELLPNECQRMNQSRWLIKLHSAIWYFRQSDRIVKTVIDPSLCPIPISVDEEMMIYPVGKKPTLQCPYSVFFEIFRHQKWVRMFAIGYSFRDKPVNIAVLENFERQKDSILVVVNPDAENEIGRLSCFCQKVLQGIIASFFFYLLQDLFRFL